MIILLIYAACFIVALNAPEALARPIKWLKILYNTTRVKPFDCSACMSFWLTFIFMIFETNVFAAILIALSSFFLQGQYFIYKMNKI